MPCHCQQCSKEPGETYTEKYKLECLERHNLAVRICEMPDRQERIERIEKYGKKHGPEAEQKLKEVIKRQWDKRAEHAE